MDRALFQQACALFDELSELAPAQRLQRLATLAAEQRALAAELEALLSADERPDGPLDRPRERFDELLLSEQLPAPEEAGALGQEIGPYRLVAELGSGGMGTVYLAERADGQFEQRVALKLVKRGLDNTQVQARFLSERQILARLEHPGIARLIDGGFAADGRPYFAMEYVAGRPLTLYAAEQGLSLNQRLALFEQVCQAVDYAHRNLVVHRDLKPSNILVSNTSGALEGSGEDQPRVKLLDFGIAKLVGGEAQDLGLTLAKTGPMTPEFAAPEQIEGRPVTTATDVYALGAVLFELITGERAFSARGRSLRELERAILEEEPARPSSLVARSAAGGRELASRLKGDLDTIVGRAMAKTPERRYPSVTALAEDLRRYQQGLPVLAHPDSLTYRWRKFLRRHRLATAAAAVAVVSLVTGLAATTWQAQVARREASRQEATKDFLVSLFEISDPDVAQGREITARMLLEQGAARVARDLAGEPRLEAEMLGLLGELYRKLGDFERAARLLEKDLAVRASVFGRHSPELVPSLASLARLKLSIGDPAAAKGLLTEALVISRSEHGTGSIEAAVLEARLAEVALRLGQLDEAETLLESVLGRLDRLTADDDPDFLFALRQQARLLLFKNQPGLAEPLFERVLAGQRHRYGELHSESIASLSDLATAKSLAHGPQSALPMQREVLALRRQLYGETHPRVGEDLLRLATTLDQLGETHEAERLLREALVIRGNALGANNPELAVNYLALGRLLVDQSRFAEAEPLLAQAVDLNLRQMGANNPHRAVLLIALARAHAGLNRRTQAQAELEQALVLLRQRAAAASDLRQAEELLAELQLKPGAPP